MGGDAAGSISSPDVILAHLTPKIEAPLSPNAILAPKRQFHVRFVSILTNLPPKSEAPLSPNAIIASKRQFCVLFSKVRVTCAQPAHNLLTQASRNYPGIIPELSRNYPGIIRNYPGKVAQGPQLPTPLHSRRGLG